MLETGLLIIVMVFMAWIQYNVKRNQRDFMRYLSQDEEVAFLEKQLKEAKGQIGELKKKANGRLFPQSQIIDWSSFIEFLYKDLKDKPENARAIRMLPSEFGSFSSGILTMYFFDWSIELETDAEGLLVVYLFPPSKNATQLTLDSVQESQ